MDARANAQDQPLRAAIAHFDRQLSRGLADFGPDPCAMWISSLDLATGRYPDPDIRPPGIPKRTYRNIDAPRGCSVYWDQPLLAAAHALSARTGEPRFAAAADRCVGDFLARCVSGTTGIFLWGNHYFWDAFAGCLRKFGGEESPACIDPSGDSGDYHEVRPLTPAWDLFWRVDPAATERCIRAMAAHVAVPATGEFNRHADGRRGRYAFLEAGGILVESFCWLAGQVGDASLAELATRVARFSWSFRSPVSLTPVSPLLDRWDRHASSTELGLWAGCLLRSAARAGVEELAEIAREAAAAWCRFAWDDRAGRFYGKLRVSDGQPIVGPEHKKTPYEPDDYCDLWHPLFPRHDYPMAMAEACVELYRRAGDGLFVETIDRWVSVIEKDLQPREGDIRYAEHYGRCIHFLLSAARTLDRPTYRELADRLARQAIDALYVDPMFRTHSGENRYDAVDGLGMLLLALLELDGGSAGPIAFGF